MVYYLPNEGYLWVPSGDDRRSTRVVIDPDPMGPSAVPMHCDLTEGPPR